LGVIINNTKTIYSLDIILKNDRIQNRNLKFIFQIHRKDNKLDSNNVIKPLIRGIEVIEILSQEGPMDIEKIYNLTKIPRSSIYRILCTLEYTGYAQRIKNNKNQSDLWELNYKLLTIANGILNKIDIKNKVRDILEELAYKTKEIVQLGVYNNGKVMYIDVVKKFKSIIGFAEVGSELPINVSAAGMVLATALSEDELEKLLKKEKFLKNTSNTIVESSKIKEKLNEVANQGYAIDDQQYATGVRCMAAPVYDYNNKIVAAINITGHISTITDERILVLKELLVSVTKRASKRMGYKV